MTYPYTHSGYVYSFEGHHCTQAPLDVCLSFTSKPDFKCFKFVHTYYGTHNTTDIIMVS
jgi:hypothetical protein